MARLLLWVDLASIYLQAALSLIFLDAVGVERSDFLFRVLASLLLFRAVRTVCRLHNLFPDSSTFPSWKRGAQFTCSCVGVELTACFWGLECGETDKKRFPKGESKGTEASALTHWSTWSEGEAARSYGHSTLCRDSQGQVRSPHATSTRKRTTFQEDPLAQRRMSNILTWVSGTDPNPTPSPAHCWGKPV